MLIILLGSCLALATGSILTMGLLVLLRVQRQARRMPDAATRQTCLARIVEFTYARDTIGLLVALSDVPVQTGLEVGFEFLDHVRGEERETLICVLIAAGYVRHSARLTHCRSQADRIRGVEMLAQLRSESALRWIDRVLRYDVSADVRLSASIALAQQSRAPDIARLLQWLGADGRRSHRLAHLFEVLADKHAEILLQAIEIGAFSGMELAIATWALSRTCDLGLLELFDRLSTHEDPIAASTALLAIGQLGHAMGLQSVLANLTNPSSLVRDTAEKVAARMGVLPAEIAGLKRLVAANDQCSVVG